LKLSNHGGGECHIARVRVLHITRVHVLLLFYFEYFTFSIMRS